MVLTEYYIGDLKVRLMAVGVRKFVGFLSGLCLLQLSSSFTEQGSPPFPVFGKVAKD